MEQAELRVLEVIDSLGAGGAESLMKYFVQSVAHTPGIAVDVVVLYGGGLFEEATRASCRHFLSLGLDLRRQHYDPRAIARLVKIVRAGAYDVVHTHLFPANLLGALASLFCSRRIVFVTTEHNQTNGRRGHGWIRPLESFLYSRYERIVCVSEATERNLLRWVPDVFGRTVVILNAIPISAINGRCAGPKRFDVLACGRLIQQKGFDVLLSAVKLIKDSGNEIRVGILGSGQDGATLEKLAEELGVGKTVEFLGVQSDVASFMSVSRIFAFPSRWEGLPMALLEAMAAGMPIVASSIPGVSEVLENGVEGLLVPADSPGELAAALSSLLSNETRALGLGYAAWMRVRRDYSIGRYRDELIEVYENALGHRAPRLSH